jgi:hypothetical protein
MKGIFSTVPASFSSKEQRLSVLICGTLSHEGLFRPFSEREVVTVTWYGDRQENSPDYGGVFVLAEWTG